jgi:2-oxoisovalerate dehydrogenase E1 component
VDPGIDGRFLAFVAERFPFALPAARQTLAGLDAPARLDPDAIRQHGASMAAEVSALALPPSLPPALPPLLETIPGTTAADRLEQARLELRQAVLGFFEREAIASSLTPAERHEILRGMLLTRAVDNRLKRFYSSGEVQFQGTPFQGKGFRSLGQEAIYAAAIRLRRGDAWHDATTGWQGDVVGPLIRDAGVALAMRPEPTTMRMILNAQMGKAGEPMDGRDLHIGDLAHGILPPTAPLAISTLTLVGMALAFKRKGNGRIAVSFIGDGGSSLGEWHEAINAAAAHRLPMVFCIENNQIALSTPLPTNTAARVFADKAEGYGIPGFTIDGTDPDAIAAAFTWAAGRAREGHGPTLIEVVCMRMCGHAHHDDMLYFGTEPRVAWDYPSLGSSGGYVDREKYSQWSRKDPIATYAARLEQLGLLEHGALDALKAELEAMVDREAQAVVAAPWPDPARLHGTESTSEITTASQSLTSQRGRARRSLPSIDPGAPFDNSGVTFLEAIALGIADAMRADPRVFVYGQDVGAPYGNAFLMLKPLLPDLGDRIVDSPLAEGAVLGVCIGAALAGLRPIGEMQFNDFVATGFNQLVNNAAKIRFRWGGSVPMVVRMPWGGRRHAGPYHSQNTEAWFYRTPGLKIVVPSTPEDARALLLAAVADPDPVLFYEHIALYRDPRIRQHLAASAPDPLPLGTAALRRSGDDLAIITYGAYVHVVLRVAERLASGGVNASVLDLRSLAPLDREAILALTEHCSRVLVVHEDTRTGGIGESIAAIIQEQAFEWLDAPVRIVGALDTPVPYSPPLEAAFLPSESEIEQAARLLLAY